jgi:glycogen synthase
MRIAFVTVEFVADGTYYGGLANYVYNMAKALRASGHEPVVIVAAERNAQTEFEGIEVHHVDVRPGDMVRLFNIITRDRFSVLSRLKWQSFRLSQVVRRLNRRKRLSIVQYTHLLGTAMLRPKSIPAVVRLSSYFPMLHKNGDYAAAAPWFVRQMTLAEQWGIRRVDGVFGPSSFIAAQVEKDVHTKIALIPSPLEPEVVALDTSILDRLLLRGKRYFLFVGRLCSLKGLYVIAEALPQLLTAYKDLHFVLCGRDDPSAGRGGSVIGYVWEKAGSLRDRVVHTGALEHRFLYPIMDHAQALVLPSLVDNMPNACLEAMLRRKLVIGTRGTGGFDELIIDGENGLLSIPGDASSLLQQMDKALMMTPEQKKNLVNAAFQSIQRLKPEAVAKQHIEFYQRIIDAKMHRTAIGFL